MNKQKFPFKLIEQKVSNDGNSKYLQLATDLIVPGYTKKDGTEVPAMKLERYSFVEFYTEPTDEQIIQAENKSAAAGTFLQKRKDTWGFGMKDPSKLSGVFEVKPRKDQE